MPSVEPTLLIGLGGTGREVLLRLRRRFFLAGYPVQPWISYLWVDTAARQPHEKFAKALPKDYVTRETLFTPEEICDIGVKKSARRPSGGCCFAPFCKPSASSAGCTPSNSKPTACR